MRICLSLFGTTESIRDAIVQSPHADLYEIRLDLSADPDLPLLRSTTSKPLLFTSSQKPELLAGAVPFADYLDFGERASDGPRTIVSVHRKEGDPGELWRRFSGNHLTKIVLDTDNYSTMARLLELNRHERALCFAMGETGAFTRILSLFRGAPWIYAALPGRETAEGQFTLHDLVEIYRIRRFSVEPEVFGILGNPVSHSRSPLFHNRRFAEENLNWIYLPFPCRDPYALFRHAEDFRISGLSITHPHKEAVLPLVSSAAGLSSCNTVCRKDGKWYGTNTDVEGVKAVLSDVPWQGKRIVIVGAGGAARTIASVVCGQASSVTILNRTVGRARELAGAFGASSGSLQDLGSIPHDILFQATSIGWKVGECPVNPDHLNPVSTVIDSIYVETELLRRARAIGCRAVSGEAWFVAQAEAQFRWWKQMLGK